MKKMLILGGTRFIGRVFIEKLVQQKLDEYQVFLFNRGKTNSDLFPELTLIKGDRETDDIFLLKEHDWDVIIDFSGYYPQSIKRMMEMLKGKVGRYIYTSTVSVYDFKQINGSNPITEKAPLLNYTPEMLEHRGDFTYYGQQKKACEDYLLEADWLDKVILRPSVVFGRYDYTDRHYYWLYRAKNSNQIIIPTPLAKCNYTFVEDYARLLFHVIEAKQHRLIYNATTHAPITLEELALYAASYWNRQPELIKVNTNTLGLYDVTGGAQSIALWYQLPLCFDHQKAIQDFQINYLPAKTAIHKSIDHYQVIFGEDWPEGTYGWTIPQEQAFIHQKIK